jgi:hypothetical protein
MKKLEFAVFVDSRDDPEQREEVVCLEEVELNHHLGLDRVVDTFGLLE